MTALIKITQHANPEYGADFTIKIVVGNTKLKIDCDDYSLIENVQHPKYSLRADGNYIVVCSECKTWVIIPKKSFPRPIRSPDITCKDHGDN